MNKKPGFIIASGFIAALFILIFAGVSAFGEDDTSIKGMLRYNIQTSMDLYIKANTVGGIFYIFDPIDGKLLKLRFKKLHKGIIKKGDFYVSCADFTDPDGRLVDLDFLVMPDGYRLKTIQAVIHATGGKKRKYHLE